MQGQNIPFTVFKTRVRDESIQGGNPFKWQDLNTDEVFKNKKVVIFSLPGAFTPTCSDFQVPGYEAKYDEFKELGIDEVYCISVNDAFVMWNWWQKQEVKKLKYIPDGNGEFTKAVGMLVKKENLGFGDRSWRYSMLVEDGVITKIFEEEGKSDNFTEDPYIVSDPDTMINFLKTRSI
jgi:peroxiredoxin